MSQCMASSIAGRPRVRFRSKAGSNVALGNAEMPFSAENWGRGPIFPPKRDVKRSGRTTFEGCFEQITAFRTTYATFEPHFQQRGTQKPRHRKSRPLRTGFYRAMRIVRLRLKTATPQKASRSLERNDGKTSCTARRKAERRLTRSRPRCWTRRFRRWPLSRCGRGCSRTRRPKCCATH